MKVVEFPDYVRMFVRETPLKSYYSIMLVRTAFRLLKILAVLILYFKTLHALQFTDFYLIQFDCFT